MSYQRLLCLTERVAFVLCSAYCLLLFLSTPSLSASDPEPGMVQGDGWAATYGGGRNERANSIQQTRDGGYIVAGVTDSFGAGKEDVWVLKLRPDGTVEWQKTYGGDNVDCANSIQETSDGGYIVVGWTQFGIGWQIFRVLKLRANGTVEWQKTYGGGEASSIQETRDGWYVVAGWTALFPLWYEVDMWVLKLRADGAVEWQKTYGGGGSDWANSIQQTSDGGYIVAGWTQPSDARSQDIFVLKLKSYGAIEWKKTYGEDDSDRANSIRQTRDGGYIVVGETISFSAGEKDLWVLKLRPEGTVEWQKTYGGGGSDRANSIQQARDEGYIVAGSTSSFGAGKGNADIWVLKLGPDGSIGPSCNFIRDTSISGKDSIATVKAPSIHSINSDAYPLDSEATVLGTNASVKILCP